MTDNNMALLESGDIFLKDLELENAIICYTKALQLNPQGEVRLRIYNNLGVAYKRMGKLQQAIAVFNKGISISPNHPLFYSNLSSVYRLQNNPSQALLCVQKAIELGGGIKDYIVLIELYKLQQQFQKALETAIEATLKFPAEYEAHLSLGNFFVLHKAFDKAIQPYLNAINLSPTNTQAYNNIGVVYKELGENEKALLAYKTVLQINPHDSAVYNNLGNLLRNMGDMEGAIKSLKQSITLNPSYADAYSNIGAVYKESKHYEEAQIYYQKALALSPEHTNANFDMSLIELSYGEYERGWKKYEHRLKMGELLSKTHVYTKPLWTGEDLYHKTIILQNEQGFGDNIMFIRFVANFLELGAKVIIRTRLELVELFRSIDGVDRVCSEEEDIPEHDFYLPLLSSALRFKTTLKTIPTSFPYLYTPSLHVALKLDKNKKNIGIVWSSSSTNKDFKNKYIGLENYKELFELEGIDWYSLQVGEDAMQIKTAGLSHKIVDLSSMLSDFSFTAKVIDMLDLVITTDTAVAHLCGALNKEAWVLAPRPADWRWMQEGNTTPWYQSLRIFRQKETGDWRIPISDIKEKLSLLGRIE